MKYGNELIYVLQDYIGNDAKALEFRDNLSNYILEAQNIIENEKLPITLALKTTFALIEKEGYGLSLEGKKIFDEAIQKITYNGISVYVDAWKTGACRTLYGILFDSGLITLGYKTIATSNLDCILPNLNLKIFLELAGEVSRKNALIGVAGRNVLVKLSSNPENNYLRKIMEGFVALNILDGQKNSARKIIDFGEMKGIDKAYNYHGDFVCGAFVFNPYHENSFNFIKLVCEEGRKRKFFGFEGEYFMMMNILYFGDLIKTYSHSLDNPFEISNVYEERQKIIQTQIREPMKKLAGSYVGNKLIETISKRKVELEQFYSKDEVEEVAREMLGSLKVIL